MLKIVLDDNRTKLGMEVLPIGVVKRRLNPNGLGHKIYNSRNKKRCFICNTYDNVISEYVIIFEYYTIAYVCIDCKKKLQKEIAE